MTYDRGDGIYRGIILATAGLMLIGTSPSKQGHDKLQNANSLASKSAAPNFASPEQPVAPSPDQGCEPGRDERKSDLCAQWKAADAASNAAQWAWWQIILSALGVVGLGLTLWFNFRALRLAEKADAETRDALDIAARNADAASKLVKITADANRPWIKIDCGPIKYVKHEDFLEISCQVEFTNIGNTVARHFNYDAKRTFVGQGDVTAISEVNSTFAAIKSKRAADIISLMPGESATHTSAARCRINGISDISSRRVLIVAAAHYQIEADGDWKASEISFIVSFAVGLKSSEFSAEPILPNLRRFVTGLTT